MTSLEQNVSMTDVDEKITVVDLADTDVDTSSSSSSSSSTTENKVEEKPKKKRKRSEKNNSDKKPKSSTNKKKKTTDKKNAGSGAAKKRKAANGKAVTTKKKKPTTKKKKPMTKKKPKNLKRLPPKRTIVRSARSVWISYLSSVRAEKRPEHSNLSFGELCKILSPVWRTMTDEQKQPFTDAYERDKLRYQQQLKNLSEEDKKILRAHKRRRRAARAGKPKSTVSGYMRYVCSARPAVVEANQGITFQEIGRSLGKQWRELSQDQRQIYLNEAIEDRKRYENEMNEWRAEEECKRVVRKKEREQKALERKARVAAKAVAAAEKKAVAATAEVTTSTTKITA
jgi:ABC-type transporter MlaC component